MVFLDRPLLDVRPDFDHIEAGQMDDFRLTTVAPGAGTPWKDTTKVRRKIKFPFLLGTKAEWRAFRDFFAAARGSQIGFWLPLWLTDYEAYEGAQGTTALKIKDIDLAGSFVADEQFAYLALIDRGVIEPHEIANITILPNGDEQLNLAAPIAAPFNILATGCCGLIFCRVANEALKYRYVTDGVVLCSLDFEELPREYVTPHLGSTALFLYEFTRGLKVWRMTNWPEPLVLDGECWSPDNIRHGAIRAGVDFISEELDLTVATDTNEHPLRYYLNRSAYESTDIQIWETNADAFPFDRTKPLYSGRIGAVDFKARGEISATCSSLLRIGELQVPTKQAQRTCNHRLFDEWCGVSAALFQIDGTLSAVTDDYVEASAFSAEAAARGDSQWFALGEVEVGLERRMVVGQSGAKLYLDEPFLVAEAGQSCSGWPGCNKRPSHCVFKFDNIDNMIAFPYAPNGNPQFENLLNPVPAGGKKEG